MYKLRQQAPIFQRPHDLLSVIGYALESITESRCKKNSHRTKFDTKGQPQTSFSSYLRRIYEFMKCSNSCFISALVLLDRIVEVNPVYSISSQNVHKLFMTAILVAAKMIDDQTYNQKYYSQVAGLKLSELNSLEFQFLSAISFDAFVSKENFESYVDKLENLYENNFKDMRASERDKKKNQTISNPQSESQSKKGEKDSCEITVPEG